MIIIKIDEMKDNEQKSMKEARPLGGALLPW